MERDYRCLNCPVFKEHNDKMAKWGGVQFTSLAGAYRDNLARLVCYANCLRKVCPQGVAQTTQK